MSDVYIYIYYEVAQLVDRFLFLGNLKFFKLLVEKWVATHIHEVSGSREGEEGIKIVSLYSQKRVRGFFHIRSPTVLTVSRFQQDNIALLSGAPARGLSRLMFSSF